MSESLSRRTLLRLAGGTAVAAAAGPALSACSSSSPSSQQQQQNAGVALPAYIPYQGVKPDLAPTEDGVMAGFLRYPATPVVGIPDRPGTGKEELTAFISQFRPIPPPASRNEYWRNINDKLGVTMNLQMTPNSNYDDKLPTVLSGELPDFTMVLNTPNLPQLMKAKCQDLTEFLSGDAVKDYPMLANLRPESWRTTVFNGGIYGIPIPRERVGVIWYTRVDLVKSLGLNPAPATFAEFKELAKAVTDAKSNRWAFHGGTGVRDFILRMMGAPVSWQEDGGKFTSVNELEQTKQAISDTRELVKAGYFHPDTFVKGAPFKDWLGGGRIVMAADNYSAWPQYVTTYLKPGSPVEFDGMLPPKYDASSKPNLARGVPSFSTTVFKKTDDKERVKLMLRVANYLAAPFGTREYLINRYGKEGVDYTMKNGDPILTAKGEVEHTAEFYRIADAPWPLYEPGHPEETKKEHAYQLKAVPMTLANPADALYSETWSRKRNTLTKLTDDALADILQGRKEISAWDETMDRWRKQGGDQVRKEYEEAFAAAK
jgi:putative aldouronate transport system substrate-binding protein